MAHWHADLRPEGPILLQALIMGSWYATCHIASIAGAMGIECDLSAGPMPEYCGENETQFYTITTKGD